MRSAAGRRSATSTTAVLMLGGWSGACAQSTSVCEVDRPWGYPVPMRADTCALLNVRRWPRLSLGFSLQYLLPISVEADLNQDVYPISAARMALGSRLSTGSVVGGSCSKGGS